MENSIKLLLRSSDEILHVLEAYSIPTYVLENGLASNGPDLNDSMRDPRNKRIIAVVTHRDDENDWEEGRYVCFLRIGDLAKAGL